MSDKFIPITMQELSKWIFTELEHKNSIFGIPKDLFFVPQNTDKFKQQIYGQKLDTPFGVAAGPHSQMAQNIIASWLCGARFIELKTIQTLDELEVSKPCIDMLDVGYNVEWSQELKLNQSFEEYLRAWVLIYALHKKLKFQGNSPGMVFNLSVGYNLEGILKSNVQEFLKKMRNAKKLLEEYTNIVKEHYSEIKNISIPCCLSNNVTLSTMHGCPPDEIGRIATYLIEEQGLHTNVKLNPTLLGPEELRRILSRDLGYREITVPDIAFEHDLKYSDAILLLKDLQQKAVKKGVIFGVKLSNTLEVENHRNIFEKKEKMMYLSGRPLHALTVNLARKLAVEFNGQLLMSFAGGADCFNVAELLRCGMKTITVSSDILRPGGYTRLLQYIENTVEAMDSLKAVDIPDLICKSAISFEMNKNILERLSQNDFVKASTLENLKQYANFVFSDPLLLRDTFERKNTKTNRELEIFDCIKAPCTDECPINQKVPLYIEQVQKGNIEKAAQIIRNDNPIPTILGKACNHQCETTCTRTHYDEPIAIREIKRFIIDKHKNSVHPSKTKNNNVNIAIIGAGPCGLSAAYFLAQYGYSVTIFEEKEQAAGMVSQTIPQYRATLDSIEQDIEIIKKLGVKIHYGYRFGKNIPDETADNALPSHISNTNSKLKNSNHSPRKHISVPDLKQQGFKYYIIAVGAQKGMPLGIDGESSNGVIDGIKFLRAAKNKLDLSLGATIGVIGAGDVAMDCARVANRLTGGKVSIIYRRSIEQMPAHKEELDALIEEGIEINELVAPKTVISKNGRISAIRCSKMRLGKPDASDRKRPIEIPNTDFCIPFDNLIIAIGQQPDFSFLDDLPVKLNKKGYIDVSDNTLETSVKGVYAGGDAIQSGPLTIVKACGDGKIIADSIRSADESVSVQKIGFAEINETDTVELLKKRAHRKFRVPILHLPVEKRDDFDEIIQMLDEKTAKQEAKRCLKCNTFCNTCVSVCPNKAIISYKITPFEIQLPIISRDTTETFAITQQYQIAIFTPYCNECGNCAMFCPSAGKPHIDKPRLYNNIKEFETQRENAFMIFNSGKVWSIRAKFNNDIHELTLADKLLYSSPNINARIDRQTFKVLAYELPSKATNKMPISLKNCAIMYSILIGIKESMAELPVNIKVSK